MVPPCHGILRFLSTGSAAEQEDRPYFVIVRTPEEFSLWLDDPSPALQWIQVEGLLDDSDAWAAAAQSITDTPLDVVLSNPAAEFASLYRLVDVRASRDVRVTMPASPEFMNALRLAVSLGLPVRLLPGQPSPEMLKELTDALDFYLHDPLVDAPIEPFHSLLAGMHGVDAGSLWVIQEEELLEFVRDYDGRFPLLSRPTHQAPEEASNERSVEQLIASIIEQGGECTECPWWQSCAGYFKWPDRMYSCTGVKRLFASIAEAASELAHDLAEYESPGQPRRDKVWEARRD